jgi:hypothetical protein
VISWFSKFAFTNSNLYRYTSDTFGGSHWLLSNPLSACKYPLAFQVTGLGGGGSSGGGVPAAHLAVSPEKMIVLTAGMELVVHR